MNAGYFKPQNKMTSIPTPFSIESVLEAARVGESVDWEFKSAKGGLPRSLWETYSAMANTDGGIIVLGVAEGPKEARLDGLENTEIDKYRKEFWDNINNRNKVNVNLLKNTDVEAIPCGGSKLLAIHVPCASRTQRPVYLGPTPFGNTFRRQHEGDYRCLDEEVRRMLADADPVPADHRILEGFTLEDLDAESISQYRQRFSATKPGHPWLALETAPFLEKLAGWRQDRATGKSGLTLAGLLMFGKDQSIRLPEASPNYYVDYREKLEEGVRWTDRLYPEGTWEANLFQFYQRVWPRLTRDLKVPFQLEGGVRRDETPVHVALREALVNALIHADYAAPGGIVIERYADRFILANPGRLLVAMEQLRRGGVSECRNKALQQMFQMIGGGERAGSGFDKIQEGWRNQHWRAPRLRTQFEPDRVILEMPMVSLIPDKAHQALQARFGDEYRRLSDAEVQALATAFLEDEVSNTRLQELMKDHPVEITKMLNGLCDRGFLISDQKRRWTRYHLTDQAPDLLPLFKQATPTPPKEAEGLPTQGGDSQHKKGGTPNIRNHGLPTQGGDSQHKGKPLPELTSDVQYTDTEWDTLLKIADPAAKSGRLSPPKMRQVIKLLCQNRFLTTAELGKLLNRHPAGLQQRFLKPMVKEDLLRLRYPEATNRPDQAYMTNPAH